VGAAPITTESITLRRFDFSETSQVAHLLTRSAGRLNGLAKGIKRSKRAALFDLFSYGRLSFVRKPAGQLQLVTEYDAIETFPGIRSSLERWHAALYFLELAIEMAPEGDPTNPALFDALLSGLRGLEAGEPESSRAIVVCFELEFLAHAGFAPRVASCLGCGTAVEKAKEPLRFVPGDGGFLCASCFLEPKPALATPVTKGALRILESLARRSTPAGEPIRAPKVPDDAVEELRAVLDAHVRAMIEKDLKTARFLRGGR
jgi:DNA repair protein RecO (recombination protein O)